MAIGDGGAGLAGGGRAPVRDARVKTCDCKTERHGASKKNKKPPTTTSTTRPQRHHTGRDGRHRRRSRRPQQPRRRRNRSPRPTYGANPTRRRRHRWRQRRRRRWKPRGAAAVRILRGGYVHAEHREKSVRRWSRAIFRFSSVCARPAMYQRQLKVGHVEFPRSQMLLFLLVPMDVENNVR